MVHRAGLRHISRTDLSQMWLRSRFMCFYCSDFLKPTWTHRGFIRRQVWASAGFLMNFVTLDLRVTLCSGQNRVTVETTEALGTVFLQTIILWRSDDHLTECCLPLWCCEFKPTLICKLSKTFLVFLLSSRLPETVWTHWKRKTEMHLQESDRNQRTGFLVVGLLESIWICQNKWVKNDLSSRQIWRLHLSVSKLSNDSEEDLSELFALFYGRGLVKRKSFRAEDQYCSANTMLSCS